MAINLQTIKDIRNYIIRELDDLYQPGEAGSISEIVINHITGINRLAQLRDPERPVEKRHTKEIPDICKELKKGKPVQYITGKTIFYNCNIIVRPGVLIPRPETEELVDLIISENPGFSGTIADMATGSGCIAVALAVNLPGSLITATDISQPALATARENAVLNNVKITFVKADILSDEMKIRGKFDIIVSNPPYVRESEKAAMHRNVLDFEPHRALFVPDEYPLIFYRAILGSACTMLNQGGKIYFEINEAMGELMRLLLETYNYRQISLIKDINGKDRIIKGMKDG